MSLPNLLLLPGLLNDAELWRDQLTGLADIAHCQVGDLTGSEQRSPDRISGNIGTTRSGK